MTDWQFGDLRMFGYRLVVADPPWNFELYNEQSGCYKGAAHHYKTMRPEQILKLRVGDLIQGEGLLLLWVPTCLIPFGLDVMAAWGFVYKSELIWRKLYQSGKPRMGTGYRVRSMHECILLGTIGHHPKHKPFPSVIDGIAREHSRKPDELYRMLEKHCPDSHGARADLFARTRRDGWESFGDELDKFEKAA